MTKMLTEVWPGDRMKMTEAMAPGRIRHGILVVQATFLDAPYGPAIYFTDGTVVQVTDLTVPIEMAD